MSTQPLVTISKQLDPLKLANVSSCVAELNKRYAVVKAGGKAVVVDTANDTLDFLSFADFERLFVNVDVLGGKRACPLGRFWLTHPNRRQYLDGIVFQPGTTSNLNVYNLWSGFAVKPDAQQGCPLFLDHLKTVICSSNRGQYEYLLNWLALMIQKPGTLPGVAIGLLSGQGTGKGLMMQYLQKLLGRHYKHIIEQSHLVGSFSGHLQDAVLVFADELSWTGDKDGAGILKGLITEPTRMMEKKFVDAIQVKNCIHLIIASNEAWAIPAELSDRRYCVMDVSDCKKGDHTYFANLSSEMDSGGPASLLYLLQQRDISMFVPNNFPKTAARANQQMLSLPPSNMWLSECLQIRMIIRDVQGWPARALKSDVYGYFCEWFGRTRSGRALPPLRTFTAALKSYGITIGRDSGPGRPYVYVFPELETVRRKMEEELGAEIDWEDSD